MRSIRATVDASVAFINLIEECVIDDTGDIMAGHAIAIFGAEKEAETERGKTADQPLRNPCGVTITASTRGDATTHSRDTLMSVWVHLDIL
jgi:hypothetical protein